MDKIEIATEARIDDFKRKLAGEGCKRAIMNEGTVETAAILSALIPIIALEAIAHMSARNGMRWNESYTLSADVMLETVKLLRDSGMHPSQLKDSPCEPASLAIQGFNTLEHELLRASMIDACCKTYYQIAASLTVRKETQKEATS